MIKRDKNGRFISTGMKPKRNRKKPANNTGILTNYVTFVVDESGSMGHLRQDVVTQINSQLQTLRENNAKYGQRTLVTVRKFSEKCPFPDIRNVPIEMVRNFTETDYYPQGGTALLDAVGYSVDEYALGVPHDKDTSFLVIVITDGEENQSKKYSKAQITAKIQTTLATDHWTFAFMCPQDSVRTVESLGVPSGCIQPWEATRQGLYKGTMQTQSGINTYYASRALGSTSVQSFYTPDLSNLTATAMKRTLDDSSKDFLRVPVPYNTRIDEFVEKTTGNSYMPGTGFYELTKTEKVQDYKGLIIQERSTNKLFSGISGSDLEEVRSMLGLPISGTIKVKPASHPNYTIYVQSTSLNRKLLIGTTLLLNKKA